MAFGFTMMSTAFIRMESRNDIVKYLCLIVKVLWRVAHCRKGILIQKAVKDSFCPLDETKVKYLWMLIFYAE